MRRLRHFTIALFAGFMGGLGFLYAQGHFDMPIAAMKRVVAEQSLPTQNESRVLRSESNYVAQNMHRDAILERRQKKARAKSLRRQRLTASSTKLAAAKLAAPKSSAAKSSAAKSAVKTLRVDAKISKSAAASSKIANQSPLKKKISKTSSKPSKKQLASR